MTERLQQVLAELPRMRAAALRLGNDDVITMCDALKDACDEIKRLNNLVEKRDNKIVEGKLLMAVAVRFHDFMLSSLESIAENPKDVVCMNRIARETIAKVKASEW